MGTPHAAHTRRHALDQQHSKAAQGVFKSANRQTGFARLALTNWLLAAALALAMASAYHLDADDHSAEWPTSPELRALQATQAGTQRRELAAQALCTAERGPQSEARWTPEGDLVCTTRRNDQQAKVLEAKL